RVWQFFSQDTGKMLPFGQHDEVLMCFKGFHCSNNSPQRITLRAVKGLYFSLPIRFEFPVAQFPLPLTRAALPCSPSTLLNLNPLVTLNVVKGLAVF
ncbi:MAG: hypothetical protein VB108_08470, partial [Anaerolineaceae bacterium]|nr:hypothetical protein [Anaerolineaceae bacterium]